MDQYDKQIERLLDGNPNAAVFGSRVWSDWLEGIGLFKMIGSYCGCLTQIRSNTLKLGPTPELTAAIRADQRIPLSPIQITKESLPVFAEWQRKIDAIKDS